jgi:hypothetical protein
MSSSEDLLEQSIPAFFTCYVSKNEQIICSMFLSKLNASSNKTGPFIPSVVSLYHIPIVKSCS